MSCWSTAAAFAMRSSGSATQVLVGQGGWVVGSAMSLPRPAPSAPPPRWHTSGPASVDRRLSRLPPQPSRPAPSFNSNNTRQHRHTMSNVSTLGQCTCQIVFSEWLLCCESNQTSIQFETVPPGCSVGLVRAGGSSFFFFSLLR